MVDKYEPIRRMSREDRKAIYDFAIKRSEEILRGDDEKAGILEADTQAKEGD